MGEDRMIYGCAIMAHRPESRGDVGSVTPMLWWAGSEDEAVGKGIRVAVKLYPGADGYRVTVSAVVMGDDMAQRLVDLVVDNCKYGEKEAGK